MHDEASVIVHNQKVKEVVDPLAWGNHSVRFPISSHLKCMTIFFNSVNRNRETRDEWERADVRAWLYKMVLELEKMPSLTQIHILAQGPTNGSKALIEDVEVLLEDSSF